MAPPAAIESTITSCCLIGQERGQKRLGKRSGRLSSAPCCGQPGSSPTLRVRTFQGFSICSNQGPNRRGVHRLHRHTDLLPSPATYSPPGRLPGYGGQAHIFTSLTGQVSGTAPGGQPAELFLFWPALRVRDRCRVQGPPEGQCRHIPLPALGQACARLGEAPTSLAGSLGPSQSSLS